MEKVKKEIYSIGQKEKETLDQIKHETAFVLGAAYGTTCEGKDVTQIVQKLIDQGFSEIKITNENMGGDPVIGQQKQFGIVYEINNIRYARCATEGDTIKFI